MGLFVCDECQCVENTALGQYWGRNSDLFPEPYNGKALCSECASPTYVDGKPVVVLGQKMGEWHGEFPKRHVDDFPKERYGDDFPKERYGELDNYPRQRPAGRRP